MSKLKFMPILMIICMTFSSSFVMAKEVEEHELRVLVIEQNPVLASKGITAAEVLGQAEDVELVVDVKIVVYEIFDEFVTSQQKITLTDGSESYTLDEETWFELMDDGWRNYWISKDVREIGEYQYDYEYLIEKFDLIERKNNGEFDQVWLVGADPINPYETVMVGNNPYWVNGPAIQKDCDNFIIMTLYISRRDANFECFGYMAENVMRKVFRKDL